MRSLPGNRLHMDYICTNGPTTAAPLHRIHTGSARRNGRVRTKSDVVYICCSCVRDFLEVREIEAEGQARRLVPRCVSRNHLLHSSFLCACCFARFCGSSLPADHISTSHQITLHAVTSTNSTGEVETAPRSDTNLQGAGEPSSRLCLKQELLVLPPQEDMHPPY